MKRKIAAAFISFITLSLCGCSQPQIKYLHVESIYNIREKRTYECNCCLKCIKTGEDPSKWILIEDYDNEHRSLKGVLIVEYLGIYDARLECPYCN